MFLEPNGTFTQEIYPESIFYQDNQKKWVPIENKLVNANEGDFKVKNKANSFGLDFGDNAKMRFEEKDMFIEIEPKGAKPSKGTVNENKIKYAKILPQVDIEYTSKNDEIKEDIILLNPEAANTFTFNVKTKNLKIQKDSKTGILNLHDNKGNLVAYFMKPFMIDANDEISEKVSLEYKKINGQEQLVVTADSEWLQDPNRAYPVKVDPTIIKADPDHLYKDTFVSDFYPSSQFSAANFMYSGYTPTYGKTRSLVQNILPDLPSSAKVTGGSMGLYQRVANSQTTVDVHQNITNWTASGTTWNNQPSFSATPEASITSTALGYWDFNITNLLKKWYNADAPNYGIIVKHRTETSQYKEFESVNYMYNMPKITVNYEVDPIGYEDQWGFTPEGVNGFNGNLIDQVTDLDVPGRGIPANLTRTYNSRSNKEGILGYGWRTNLELSCRFPSYLTVKFQTSVAVRSEFFQNCMQS